MDFKDLVDTTIANILDPLATLILAGSIVFFLWNTMMFIKNSDNEEARAQFKYQATWSIVAIAVMVSLWGIVAWFTNTAFPDETGGIPQLREDYTTEDAPTFNW